VSDMSEGDSCSFGSEAQVSNEAAQETFTRWNLMPEVPRCFYCKAHGYLVQVETWAGTWRIEEVEEAGCWLAGFLIVQVVSLDYGFTTTSRSVPNADSYPLISSGYRRCDRWRQDWRRVRSADTSSPV